MSKREKICCIYMIKNKLNKINLKMLTKRPIRNKKYMELLDYLDNSSVETIENDYNVKYITYQSEVEQLLVGRLGAKREAPELQRR